MEREKSICPNCKSKEIVKRGFIHTKINGRRQRYYCKSCNRKFIPKDAFYRMRNSPQKITCALDLFFRTRKLKETLADFNPQIEFQQLQLRVF